MSKQRDWQRTKRHIKCVVREGDEYLSQSRNSPWRLWEQWLLTLIILLAISLDRLILEVKRREAPSVRGTSGSESDPGRLSRRSQSGQAHPEETDRHVHAPALPARLFCRRSTPCRAGPEPWSQCPSKNPQSVRSGWPPFQSLPRSCLPAEVAQVIPGAHSTRVCVCSG